MQIRTLVVLVTLTGLACSLPLADAFGEPSAPPLDTHKGNLKIFTWNLQMLPTAFESMSEGLRKGQTLRLPWVIDYLNQHDYDIVVLQEVIDPGIAETLKEAIKARYPYIIAPASKMGIAGTTGGVLLAGRIPLRYVAHIVFKHVTGVDELAEKGGILVETEVNGIALQVVGTHLQAGHQDLKDLEYVELGDGLVKPYKKEGVPLILAGDMNTEPGTAKFDLLLKATDMTAFPIDDPTPFTIDGQNSWQEGKTRPGKPDHILLNPRGTNTTIVHQTIERPRQQHEGKTIDLSDHYGVVGEIMVLK